MFNERKIGIYDGMGYHSREFSLDWLKKQGNFLVKHIQLDISGEPILRMGRMCHRDLLTKVLKEFHSEFNFGPLPALPSEEGPLKKGKNYEMVGTGLVLLLPENDYIRFYSSSLYGTSEEPLPTNRKNLESLGIEILSEKFDLDDEPYYKVKIREKF